MAKWHGEIGYGEDVETKPGVWVKHTRSYSYYGDIIENVATVQQSAQVNDNINISNRFSIVSDPYARMNYQTMLYITHNGTKWKITNVKVQYPRLILTVGGVYNG